MTDVEFTYVIKVVDDNGEQYYMKSTIDEQNNTVLLHLTNLKNSWVGTLNQEQVRTLARKFPSESKDSFYSHTQRAFSKGNKAEFDGKTYVFSSKKLDKNRLEFAWKEKVEALNSLKAIGQMELQERPNEEVLTKIMDYTINEIGSLRCGNEQKLNEIQRIDSQLSKALETVKRTVDLKERLEADLYRKFAFVLNSKKAELIRLKNQLESYQDERSTRGNDAEHDADSYSRSLSPSHSTTLHDFEHRTNKRRRDASSSTDTSDNEEHQDADVSTGAATGSNLTTNDNSQKDSLELGDDQTDYKSATINQHHQRRNYVTGTNNISTRPFVKRQSIASTGVTPTLSNDSQTTDDLLNKI